MILGRVAGRIWSDRQLGGLDGKRLVVVTASSGDLVAVDAIDVTAGDLVLVATDDAAVALEGAPVDAVVVARVADMDAGIERPGQP